MADACGSNPGGKSVKDVRAEQESKRARGALSCAECRRLKLRCDKRVPCSSCQRRGCASICPNGSLTTGQGTRFVLADTASLHKKLNVLSCRIRDLEEALRTGYDPDSGPHPLLDNDLLDVKNLQDVHINPDIAAKVKPKASSGSDYLDAFGTLAIREDGAATFYGRSAGSESLLLETAGNPPVDSLPSALRLTDESRPFVDTFPLSPTNAPFGGNKAIILSFLPSAERANTLFRLYLDQSQWFFGPVTHEQFVNEIYPLVYDTQASAGSSLQCDTDISPPDLSLLFGVFALGSLTDPKNPPAPENIAEAEHFYDLSRAALCLYPVLDTPPSVSTVQSLSLMSIYQGMALKENAIESMWSLMGLATTLAQSIGLHRDSARWKLKVSEVQKRRALFWELFATDGWQSLATGRPPSLTPPFTDCSFAQDKEQTIDEDGNTQFSFPAWKARFGAECIAPVVEATLIAQTPAYSRILDVDRKIKDLALPKYAERPLLERPTLQQMMMHYMPINYRAFILVYLHRSFFAQAVCDEPIDPLRSQFAHSFLVAYESACRILHALKDQFGRFPDAIARYWPLWTHAFSSTIIIGSVVTRAPRSKFAVAAFRELSNARKLFESAAKYGGRAVIAKPILVLFHEKAQLALDQVRTDPTLGRMKPIRAPDRDDEQDELAIFGGKTRLVETKVPASTSPMAGRSPASSATPPQLSKTISQDSSMSSSPGLAPLTGGFREYEGQWTSMPKGGEQLWRRQEETRAPRGYAHPHLVQIDHSSSTAGPYPAFEHDQPTYTSIPQQSMQGPSVGLGISMTDAPVYENHGSVQETWNSFIQVEMALQTQPRMFGGHS